MALRLYNTMGRKIEEFVPIYKGFVGFYGCGPTVYNYAHIGNLRAYVFLDTLDRTLTFLGYDKKHVMNITDIGHLTGDADEGEDKMLKTAQERHQSVLEVAKFYTDAFFNDIDRLNIIRPDIVCKATEHVQDMIELIKRIEANGHTYMSGGNLYYDVTTYPDYGKLANLNLDDLKAGARIEVDQNKRNPYDFVLWFTKSKFENQALTWDSPWGRGYPGWHIECSGISMKYNGEYLDLHCGGVDNAFPHHTNEIAQSESYLGHPWCLQWCHVAHLNTSHGKMSKSKGEFLTVSLLEEKGYDPLAYRFFCLQSHYRKSLVFTWENLDNAVAAYNKLIAKIANIKDEGGVDEAVRSEYRAKFMKEMDNDLNTAMGVTALYDVLKAKTTGATKLAIIGDYDTVLSLDLLKKAEAEREKKEKAASQQSAGGFTVVSEDGTADEGIENLIRQRAEAKKAKNFAEADRIRDELKAQGIEVTDMPGGAKWKRV